MEKTIVKEKDRLGFLPRVFGPRWMIRGESLVYQWMRSLCPSYDGGHWDFYDTENGAFFLEPDCSSCYRLVVTGNGFDDEVTSEVAGIIVTAFALCHLSEFSADDRIINAYYLLMDYARDHSESSTIFRAMD